MEQLRKEVHEVKDKLNELFQMKETLIELLRTLTGSKISNDGGMVGKQIDHEKRIETIEDWMEEQKLATSKNSFYNRIIWGVGGGFIVLLIGYILQLFAHK